MVKSVILFCLAAGLSFGSTCSPQTLAGSVAAVQCVDNQVSGAATNISQAFGSSNLIGSLLIVSCSYFQSGSVTVSASDSLSNTYVPLSGLLTQGNLSMRSFYVANAKAGANTVMCSFSSGVAFNGIQISEYAGVSRISPLDATSSTTGTANGVASGSITTTGPDLVLGLINDSGTTAVSPGGSFNIRLNNPSQGYSTEDQVMLTAGAVNASFSLTAPSPSWAVTVAAFRLANSGAPLLLSQ